MMKPARYRVCTPRRQYFATLPEAIAAANAHFRRTGNDLQTAERATARARAELDELRRCARKILQLN